MRWRAHEVDGRLSASNATKIRAALRQSANWQRIYAAYQRTQPAISNNPTQDRARARAWAMLNINFNNEPLMAALRRTLAEGFALGIVSANDAYQQAKELQKAETPDYIDWKNWKPGNAAAALLIKPTRAFQNLLNGAGVTIRGINSAGYDRIGTALSDAISLGLSAPRAAKLIQDSVSNPARALSIAITEGNRAISRATLERYEGFGVEQVEWTVFDPCPECAINNGAVVELGRAFPSGNSQPPVHPNCRCALLPVIPGFDDGTSTAGRITTTPTPETELVMPSNDSEKRQIEGYQIAANPQFTLNGNAVTQESKDALMAYKSTDYTRINEILRDPTGFLERRPSFNFDEYVGYARNIELAIAVAPPLPKPMLTLRGVRGRAADFFRELTVGTIYKDDGFVSTTLSPSIANWFGGVGEEAAEGIIIEIINPVGQKGIMLNAFQFGQGPIPGEAEWLLPAGTRFEVISNDGKRIRVKIVP